MIKSFKPDNKKQVHAHLDTLIDHVKKAKMHYASLDTATKHKLIAGVAAATSLLGSILLFKKIKWKKNKDQDF